MIIRHAQYHDMSWKNAIIDKLCYQLANIESARSFGWHQNAVTCPMHIVSIEHGVWLHEVGLYPEK